MSDIESRARREKVDPADGLDTTETFLPGQIPVKDAESAAKREAWATEQQPNPVEAEKAVDPPVRVEDQDGEGRKTGE